MVFYVDLYSLVTHSIPAVGENDDFTGEETPQDVESI